MILICGPCVIENIDQLRRDASAISRIIEKYPDIDFYFKSSCVKDNRTNIKNFYGVGFAVGIEFLLEVKEKYKFKITTDFHNIKQIKKYGHVVDLIQIPAFLAMQTSLINEAVKVGKPIHIKKPQWLPPYDVMKPISKVIDQNEDIDVFITDRGTTFGYGNVMFDPRHIRKMKDTSKCDKVIVDITHLQNHSNIYDKTYAKQVGMAALAAGADGLFMESTYTPEEAKCDADAMVSTSELDKFLKAFTQIYDVVKLIELDDYANSRGPLVVYTPVTVNNKLLKDGNRRKLKSQHIRVNALLSHIDNDTTLVDLGCNTGYVVKELIKAKNVVVTAIDCEDEPIKICRDSFYLDKVEATFIKAEARQFIKECNETNTMFDNVLFLSVYDSNVTFDMMDNLLSITRGKLFLEATNHELNNKEEVKENFDKTFKKKYNAEFLTFTDYQNRILCMVRK